MKYHIFYDRILLLLTLSLISIGFVMITSASMHIGVHLLDDPFFFVKRHAFYLIMMFVLSFVILRIPIINWQRYSFLMLLVTLILLFIVLRFGKLVNGAVRWLYIGTICIQPSELSKLTLFCYLSDYLARKIKEVQNNFWDFIKPISIMILLSLLLLAQPDFGAIIILFITTLTILFLFGTKIRKFLLTIVISILIIILLIVLEPYRMRRIMSFWNPWENPFSSGYQLTQSLMAFGRGQFWGQGLGNSIQKMEYLPEAYTDFIFAIIGEELGYFGIIIIMLMVCFITFRAIFIGFNAFKINQYFSGFLAYSIGIWFSAQALINISVVVGILPTKGLTFPFLSYGGTSLFVISIAIMLLLRISFETQLAKSQVLILK